MTAHGQRPACSAVAFLPVIRSLMLVHIILSSYPLRHHGCPKGSLTLGRGRFLVRLLDLLVLLVVPLTVVAFSHCCTPLLQVAGPGFDPGISDL